MVGVKSNSYLDLVGGEERGELKGATPQLLTIPVVLGGIISSMAIVWHILGFLPHGFLYRTVHCFISESEEQNVCKIEISFSQPDLTFSHFTCLVFSYLWGGGTKDTKQCQESNPGLIYTKYVVSCLSNL